MRPCFTWPCLALAALLAHAASGEAGGAGGIYGQQARFEAIRDAIGVPDAEAGSSVAVSGDTAVVGAPGEDTTGGVAENGAVYVFERTAGEWTQRQRLTGGDNGRFGAAVAISGDTMVVGEPDAFGVAADVGAISVFVRTAGVWSLQERLVAPDGFGSDRFGTSVSVDGDRVAVGTPFTSLFRGSVYLFERSGTSWSFVQKVVAADARPSDRFGLSVSLSNDTLVAGAPGDSGGPFATGGFVYVYVRSGGVWSEQQRLQAPAIDLEALLGGAVSLEGDTLVAGALGEGFSQGAAYVFVRSGSTWSSQQRLAGDPGNFPRFGQSLALAGETVAVGASGEDAAYVFVRAGGTWTREAKLTSDDAPEGGLGFSVAHSGDTIVAGAPALALGSAFGSAGSAFAFVRSGTTWTEEGQLANLEIIGDYEEAFGSAVAVDGDTMVVGVPGDHTSDGIGTGSVYVFERGGAGWVPSQRLFSPDAHRFFRFGRAVAVSGDTILVAENGIFARLASVYVYERVAGHWELTQTLQSPDQQTGNGYGSAVLVSGDTAFVGSAIETIGTEGGRHGAVYVLERSGGTWSGRQKLQASEPIPEALFGSALSLSGDTLLVGAQNEGSETAFSFGAAYAFTRSAGVWSQQQRITPTDPSEFARFGFSVAVSGDTLAVGALFGDGGGTDSGDVYVFTRAGGLWTQAQKIVPDTPNPAGQFGRDLSLTDDRLLVSWIVGGPDATGLVSVYGRTDGGWTERGRVLADDGVMGDVFGSPLAASGGVLAVGATGVDTAASPRAGAAYVFELLPTDLTVSIDDGQSVTVPGTPLTYTIVAGNAGPGDAVAARVSAPLPAGLSNATWTCTASSGSFCGASGAGSLDDRTHLPVNGTATYQLTATVDASATGTLTNTAAVTVAPGGTDPSAPNSATDVDALTRQADLAPSIADLPDPVGAGALVTYSVQVANRGPSDSTGLTLVDTLPAGTTFESSEPGVPTCAHASGTVTCALGSIPAGTGGTVRVVARVPRAAAGSTMTDAAAVTGLDGDPVPANDQVVEQTTVGPRAAGALGNGASVWASLAANGGAAAEHWYRLAQEPHSSYEVTIDGASGDVGTGEGPRLERTDVLGQVLQASAAVGTGRGRTLRWEATAASTSEFIHVTSAGCTTDCGPEDVYRLRSWDTTLRGPRFNNGDSQVTILLLQNPTATPVVGHLRFWGPDGALLVTEPLSLPAHGLIVTNTSTIPGLRGQAGSVTVSHSGGYAALFGKLVALEPATGFSFDNPLVPLER